MIILVFDLTSIKTLNNTKWASPFYIIGWLSLSLAFWLIIIIIIIVIIIIISTIIITIIIIAIIVIIIFF